MLVRDLPAFNAVKAGRFFVKASGIDDVLSESVRMVSFEFEGILGRSGSCTLFRVGNRDFVATTRHELLIGRGRAPTDKELESVRFVTTQNGMVANIVVEQCIFERSSVDEEYHDVLVFVVAAQAEQPRNDRHAFFPCHGFAPGIRRASMFIGYPTLDGVMDYEDNHVRLKKVTADCRYDESFRGNAQFHRRYSYEEEDRHVDGFSGGAVFSLMGDKADYELVLDGLIVRAGNGNLHIVDSDFLMHMVSK